MKVINYVMNLYQIIKYFKDLEFLYGEFFLMQYFVCIKVTLLLFI